MPERWLSRGSDQAAHNFLQDALVRLEQERSAGTLVIIRSYLAVPDYAPCELWL